VFFMANRRLIVAADLASPRIAFGGPGAITVPWTRHEQARLYRRRQCTTSRTITCQSSCSPDQ
jgi:hypothetical protein